MLVTQPITQNSTSSPEPHLTSSSNVPQTPLQNKAETIAEATVRWITMIAQNAHDAMVNYSTDNKYLEQNMWYAEDLWKASLAAKNTTVIEWMKINHKQHIGYASPAHFHRILKPKNEVIQIKFETNEFLVKPDVLPSAALKAAVTGLSIIDCGVACQIARYGALHDVLGEKKFNKLFSAESGELMNIGFTPNELQPMRFFVRASEACSKNDQGKPGNRPVKKGQLVGFEGAKYYEHKYPFSNWGNLNAICICDIPGQQKFVAFGTDPKGNTEKELCDLLLKNFKKNEDPYLIMAQDIESFRRTKEEVDSFSYSNKMYIQNIYDSITEVTGYCPGTIQEFIVELIDDLVKMPLEAVSMDYVKAYHINKKNFTNLKTNSNKK